MTHSAFRISSAPQGILLTFGTVNAKLDDEGSMTPNIAYNINCKYHMILSNFGDEKQYS